MAENRLEIFCDIGAEFGLGHASRCLALSQRALWEGEIRCWVNGDVHVARDFFGEAAEVRDLREEDPFAISLGFAVVDSYHFSSEFLLRVYKNSQLTVTIDDWNRSEFHSDIVINHNFSALDLGYEQDSHKQKFLLGPSYALLRSPFLTSTDKSSRDGGFSVLVSLGGGKYGEGYLKVLRALAVQKRVTRVHLVVPNDEDRRLVENETSENHSFQIHFHKYLSASEMSDLMGASSFAILPASVLSLEACSSNLPMAVVVTSDNQLTNASAIDHLGIGKNLGWLGQISIETLSRGLSRIFEDGNMIQEISERQLRIVKEMHSMSLRGLFQPRKLDEECL